VLHATQRFDNGTYFYEWATTCIDSIVDVTKKRIAAEKAAAGGAKQVRVYVATDLLNDGMKAGRRQ